MHPHLILTLSNAVIKNITAADFPSFSSLALARASAKLYTMAEGAIFLQSFSNYLAQLEFFECCILEEVTIDMIVIESCFFMPILLMGQSAVHHPLGEVVSETSGNSCTLSHLTAGNYTWTLQPGKHKLLLLTLRPLWFMKKSESYPILAPLTENYLSIKNPYCVLPHCAVAAELFRKFENTTYDIDLAYSSQSSNTYNFIQHCIDRYHEQLLAGNFDLNTFNKMKVLEIADYIELNCGEEILDNVTLLAQKFNLSERSLARYFKQIHHITWHEYVIKVRMLKAIDLLKTSGFLIKDIALKVGYPNQHYFSVAFKKFHKVSPSRVKEHL